MSEVSLIGLGTVLTLVWNGVPALFLGVPMSADIDAGIIPKYAGCVNGVQWFKDRGQWADGSYEPSPGTIIFFDWEGDGVTDHTGIVQKCENGTVYTVEGNSGDTCRTKTYPVGSWLSTDTVSRHIKKDGCSFE